MNIGKRYSMVRYIGLILVLMLIVSSITGCSLIASASYDDKAAKLDKHMAKIFESDKVLPSISVLVVDNGDAVYSKSFGYADVENMVEATPETNYRLASLTKMFTAMGIMILVDRGQLEYDTPVKDILDDFPEYGEKITVQHLIRHTSGLKSFYDNKDVLGKDFSVDNQVQDSDVLAILNEMDSTYFEPGKIFRYSDEGYILLGLIIEKVSGMTLTAFMEENIFKPLEMSNSLMNDNMSKFDIPNRALGTDHNVTKYITKDQSYSSATRGDGNIYTSLEDIYKWDKGLYTDVLVSAETMKEGYTPPHPVSSWGANYNSGWGFSKNKKGEIELSHTGGTQGFSTMYIRIPEKKRAIIVLGNRNTSETVYELHKTIRRIYGFPDSYY